MRRATALLAVALGSLALSGARSARGTAADQFPSTTPTLAGALDAFLASRPHAPAASGVSIVPAPGHEDEFRAALYAAVAADWQTSVVAASAAGYEIVDFISGTRRYVVLREADDAGVGPTVVLSRAPSRELIVQVPHSASEAGTAAQGAAMLERLGARAVILEGAHRCASLEPAGCDGKTSVCGTSGPFRASDVAHARESLFQAAHEVLATAFPEATIVQIHRMRPGSTQAVISDGSGEKRPGDVSLAARVRDRLRAELGQGPQAAVSCHDPDDDVFGYPRLCATTNVQGRWLAGSADACTLPGMAPSGRFLHIEQTGALLDGDAAGEAALRALGAELPCFAPGAEGCGPVGDDLTPDEEAALTAGGLGGCSVAGAPPRVPRSRLRPDVPRCRP